MEPPPDDGGGSTTAPPAGGTSPAPTVVAPVSTGAPDLSVRIADGRSRAQRGRQLRYRVRVRNHGTAAARNATVRVQLPRAVRHLRGGTLRARRTIRWRIASLAPGRARTLNLFVRVRPRARARAFTLRASASAPGERNRRDNRARDRNRLPRPTQGAATARMAAVVAPPVTGTARAARGVGLFAGLCRLVVAS